MFLLTFFFIYHLFFLLIGLGIRNNFNESDYKSAISSIAVFMPAHNEENVIANSVNCLLSISYPKSLLDVYVIADNCTDNTAREAKQAGAIVLKRFNDTQKGKQYALDWAFKQINLENYDGVCILDADNLVDKNFFREIDIKLQQGCNVVQGYVDTKNPGDSWVTANYAFMFWYLCRMQMSRTLLGFSAWLAGTGFCVSTRILRRVGWNVKTMTDDMEYTAQLLLAGEKVTFASQAICYDEKPVGIKDSLKQRLRWLRGQTQVFLHYWPGLVVSVLRYWLQGDIKRSIRAFDGCMWVPMHMVVFSSVIFTVVNSGPFSLIQMLMSVPLFFMLPMIAECIKNARAWRYLPTAGVFYYTWLPVIVYGMATCGKKNWWRTPHGV